MQFAQAQRATWATKPQTIDVHNGSELATWKAQLGGGRSCLDAQFCTRAVSNPWLSEDLELWANVEPWEQILLHHCPTFKRRMYLVCEAWASQGIDRNEGGSERNSTDLGLKLLLLSSDTSSLFCLVNRQLPKKDEVSENIFATLWPKPTIDIPWISPGHSHSPILPDIPSSFDFYVGCLAMMTITTRAICSKRQRKESRRQSVSKPTPQMIRKRKISTVDVDAIEIPHVFEGYKW